MSKPRADGKPQLKMGQVNSVNHFVPPLPPPFRDFSTATASAASLAWNASRSKEFIEHNLSSMVRVMKSI
jgi:hypothetical protein